MDPQPCLSEIKVEVTHRCPLACIHCSSDAHPSSTVEMSRMDCLRIIAEASELGATTIVFTGGEPLLWSPIQEMVRAASTRGMQVGIYTSGNSPDAGRSLGDLAQAGLSSCAFSVFAAKEEDHEAITRLRGSFTATERAVEAAKQQGLAVELHFVPMAHNYLELDALALLARKWGATRISVLRFVPQGRGALLGDRVLSRLQNIKLRNSIRALRQQGYDIRTGSPFNFLLVNDTPRCMAGKDRLIVGPDLRIYPCDAFKQIRAEDLVGSLELSCLDAHTLEECWRSSPFLQAVRRHLSDPQPEPCQACGAVDRCLSGCLAQKVIASGALVKSPDPSCLYRTKESAS